MKQYFVVNSFPPLALGTKPEISYEEIRELLRLNLSPRDWAQVVLFQRLIDIRNIRAFWLEQPLDPRGNFRGKELEEALLVQDMLPQFVSDFMDRYESIGERLRYFASLYASVYSETLPELKGFLLKYYQMEREVRLCLTALRAKEADRDLTRELQFEDPADPFVAQLLAQKENDEVILPKEYEDLKTVFLENRSEPRKLYRAILEFRFKRIEEMEANQPFDMDQVIGYLARLTIVEDWENLDDERGLAVLEQVNR